MSEPKWTVERQWSNGCEVSSRLLLGGKWKATVVGAPHLGFDSVEVAYEMAAKLNAHDDLLGACEMIVSMLGDDVASYKAGEMAREAIARAKGGTT